VNIHRKLKDMFPLVMNDLELPKTQKIFNRSKDASASKEASLERYLQRLVDDNSISRSEIVRSFLSTSYVPVQEQSITRTLLKPLNPLDIGGKVLKGGKAIGRKVGALGSKSEKGEGSSLLGPLFRKKNGSFSKSSMEVPDLGRRKSQDSSTAQSNDEWEGGVRDSSGEDDGSKTEISVEDTWDEENDVQNQGLSAMKLSAVLEPLVCILLEVFDFKEKSSFLKRNSALILLKQWWGIKEGQTIEKYDIETNSRTINDALGKLIEEERIIEFLDMSEIKVEEPPVPEFIVESPMDAPVQTRFPSTSARRSSVFANPSPSATQQTKKEMDRRKSMFTNFQFRQNRETGETEGVGNAKCETREKLVSILPGMISGVLWE
jgi:hypothetical protein